MEAHVAGPSEHAEKHPNYVAIWGVLVAALAVSMLLAHWKRPYLAAALIFAVAIAKAALVAAYYMHLKFEPRFVVLAVLSGLLCLFILFGGLVLDIVHVYGR